MLQITKRAHSWPHAAWVKRATVWAGWSSTTGITKPHPLSKMNHLVELSAVGSARCFQRCVLHDSSNTNKTNFLNETFTPVHEEDHQAP
jgi:hypothetical protein